MNIGFVLDIDEIVAEDDLRIPYIYGMHYRHFDSGDFELKNVIDFRGGVLEHNYVGEEINRRIYFIIASNKENSISRISNCLNEVQKSKFEFSQDKDEIHVLLNLEDPHGLTLSDYEKMMPCLRNNAVCVYNWLLDKYDYGGGMPVSKQRRAHAIARMIFLVVNHRREFSLRQLDGEGNPIYNLFGDSSVFFNDEERDKAVRNYYYFKNIQHLLNYSDKSLDDYLAENVVPYMDDKDEMERRIDSTSPVFIRDNRIPIEASVITEKTQGLLLKSSDNDKDYLINASDNGLVFIDDLSHKQQWQMKNTENVVDKYWKRVSIGQEHQSTISEEFITDIQERVVIHKRTVFDEVNNEVSRSRKKQIDSFKDKIDKYLLDFFNRPEGQYTTISEVLTPQDVQAHHSNIDTSLAFLTYLESGDGENLTDSKVSVGDFNLCGIREKIRLEESKRLQELEESEKEIRDYYSPGADGKPSKIKADFDAVDRNISRCNDAIRLLNFQFENWYDKDAEVKLTAKSRSLISILAGIVSSSLWATIYLKWLRPLFEKECRPPFDKYAWIIFSLLFFVGVLIGVVVIWSIARQRKELEEQLRGFKDRKKRLMRDCMDKMMMSIEKRYRHILAYHGLKTLNELVDFVRRKKDDLAGFRKTLFRLLVNYKLSGMNVVERYATDSNTIELSDIDVATLLFGPEGEKRRVAFCLNASVGSSLSEAFEDCKRKKVQFETSRFAPDYKPTDVFDLDAIEREIIQCKEEHEGKGYEYSELNRMSKLPETDGIEMDDVKQGNVGDCYFMATLATIAHTNPEYIVGKHGMIEPLGETNRFFRVKFYDKDGNRINVDIDNKFWNQGGTPIYAGVGKMKEEPSDAYDPWVMAVEKAWAKVNKGGYDAIEGASADGEERVRMVEYSYAVTGKTAFYCMTKNVPDRQKLLEMMQKHVLQDKLPITLYSASPSDTSFTNKDPHLVENHAYALRTVHEDGTFDIFNPWNNYMADENVRGKHYEKVDIDFIKDNFDVIVFFDINEGDFSSFERDLTGNASEIELASKIEELMDAGLCNLDSTFNQLNDLLNTEMLGKFYQYSVYLFNKARIKDHRGVDKTEQNLIFMEPISVDETANEKVHKYLKDRGENNINILSPRDDKKQSITIFRVSPPLKLSNFYD
ncbi:MAG: hypothetical protein E7111_03430 [Bacteroidales bacterium]|nr:hypothetical protein [Bacteroidales bacterium]